MCICISSNMYMHIHMYIYIYVWFVFVMVFPWDMAAIFGDGPTKPRFSGAVFSKPRLRTTLINPAGGWVVKHPLAGFL